MTIGKPLVCNLSLVQIVENSSANVLESAKTIIGSRVGKNVWMRIHRPPRMTTVFAKNGEYPVEEWVDLLEAKFLQVQIINPIILLIVDETTKILFQRLVGTLSLAICFGMIAQRKLNRNVEKFVKDFIGELGIRHDEFRLCCDSQSVIHLVKNVVVEGSGYKEKIHRPRVHGGVHGCRQNSLWVQPYVNS